MSEVAIDLWATAGNALSRDSRAATGGSDAMASPAQDLDASRRHMLRPAETVGLLMRNTVSLVVAVVSLADPASQAQDRGKVLLAGLALWSFYRIATRSRRWEFLAVDYVFVVAVCLGLPALVTDPDFYESNTAPQAIAGTAVVSLAVSMPMTLSLAMTAGIAAAYASGSAAILGWGHLLPVAAIYYFALQWITAALLRFMLLRVAAAIDSTRAARADAEASQHVIEAVREYEREQLALLHDTAASTLLIVGQGGNLPPQRLAAQARRDLHLLEESPWEPPPTRTELVAALRDCAEHINTPTRFEGRERLWVDGETAKALVSAARETMNNVDRHSQANELVVTVTDVAVTLSDDGIGFDPELPRLGHGVNDSILGRMRRVGGAAAVTSAPGAGTSVQLSWRTAEPATPTSLPADPDGFIERLRGRYGLALTAYALANLAVSTPHAVVSGPHQAVNTVLVVVAAASTLTAIPAIRRGRMQPVWLAAAALLAVAVVEPLLLDPRMVGGYAHWTQNAIGWCLLPLLLGLRTLSGAAVLIIFWIVGAVVEFFCQPTSETLVNIGLGTASVLGVQMFALIFNGLMRAAAVGAQEETHTHKRIALRELVERALRAEYQRRYAQLVDNVVPLLQALSDGAPVDDQLQARARAQSRRMRTLFDQAATFEHPFMQAMRPLVDAAESRHVAVTVDLAGELPDLAPVNVDAVLRPVADVMADTNDSVRIVVTCSPQDVSVSVVCHGLTSVPELSDHPAVTLEVVEGDDSVWVLARHVVTSEGATRHVLAG
ncbi:sensor histidine kinase [Mycobacterium sp. DL592]|uniref:sensor histidine kinase n=1 Tax=Mycobacterium sp. DL592 TaxID=2675524 RepID=UPI00141D9D77|nr:ATP-binding protein [Mycobacterium sp. DL592]